MSASQPAYFHLQEFSDLGIPLVGGRLYTYAQGTTALKTAYTDPAGLIPQTYTADGLGGQYIALNARGELPAALYLTLGAYDIALKRSDGSTVWTRRAEPTVDGARSGASMVGADDAVGGTLFTTVAGFIAKLFSSGGASLIGLTQTGIGAIKRTVEDKLQEQVSVYDFMTSAERNNCYLRIGTIDVANAVQKAFNAGAREFPAGAFLLGKKITTPVNIDVCGAGARNTLFLGAVGFVGDTMFELGSPAVPYGVPSVSMNGVTIDVQKNVDAAITCYGLQDGSTFDQVYIRGIRKYGVRTRWSTDGTTLLMNQGLVFSNCHVISRNDGGAVQNGAYWDLSGLYESTVINCKALGFDASGAVHTNMGGFRIGGVSTPGLVDADCQGVRLYNCSSANFSGTGNYGCFFGSAFNCSADSPTIENVQGKSFVFGRAVAVGTPSDLYSAAYCTVNSPRIYNPAGDAAVNAVSFEFTNSATQCAARNIPTLGVLPGQKIASFLSDCAVCSVDVMSGHLAPSAVSAYADFLSSTSSNTLRVYTNDTDAKQDSLFTKDQFYIERGPDGTTTTHTQYYTQVTLATEMRFCKSDGISIMTIKPSGVVALNTAILPSAPAGDSGTIWRDLAAGNALKIIP